MPVIVLRIDIVLVIVVITVNRLTNKLIDTYSLVIADTIEDYLGQSVNL